MTNCSVLVCYGTRPEIIKLAPVINELGIRQIPFKTVFTGQHKDLYRDVAHLIPPPDFRLKIVGRNRSLCQISEQIFATLPCVLKKVKPSICIVHGDTATAAIGALAASYSGIPVGHVEAGLRTYDLAQPYPEEINRQLIARIAFFNWASTQQAAENLRGENVFNISYTGNTIVDICNEYPFKCKYGSEVLITLHRRENFGKTLMRLSKEINQLARMNPSLRFLFPMHPNPHVQAMKPLLTHISLIDPLPYPELLQILSRCRCVITDSGGIQEECAFYKKKVLVCRQKTERPEGVEAGFVRLVGDDIKNNFAWAADDPFWNGRNFYGDGKARIRIVNDIEKFLKKKGKII
jgi:UDP-N-acetylglucosamine 2-epimerase (non-hydrolysing)